MKEKKTYWQITFKHTVNGLPIRIGDKRCNYLNYCHDTNLIKLQHRTLIMDEVTKKFLFWKWIEEQDNSRYDIIYIVKMEDVLYTKEIEY